MCVLNLARFGYIDKAIEFLQNLSGDAALECYEKIAGISLNLIEDYVDDPVAYESMMELMKLAMDKNIGEKNKERVQQMINLHRLRQSTLNMNITLNDLEESSNMEHFLHTAIDRILQSLKTQRTDLITKIWDYVELVSKALNIDKLRIVLKLARTVDSVHFTTLLAKIFIDHSSNNDSYYVEMTVLLVIQQYFASVKDSHHQSDSVSYAYAMAYLYIKKIKITFETYDLKDLVYFVKIGSNAFNLKEIEDFLANDARDIHNVNEVSCSP